MRPSTGRGLARYRVPDPERGAFRATSSLRPRTGCVSRDIEFSPQNGERLARHRVSPLGEVSVGQEALRSHDLLNSFIQLLRIETALADFAEGFPTLLTRQ